MPTIDRHYFRVCTRGAAAAGHDVSALLHQAGIDPAALDRPGWRGSTGAMSALVRGVIGALDDENMGFTAHPMPRGGLSFAAGLAIEGPSVVDGLRRAARFYGIANRDITTRIRVAGDDIRISVRLAQPDRDPDRYFGEFWLMGWHRLACWLAAETIPLASAAFDYEPHADYAAEFCRLFPCPHRYDADMASVRMDSRALAAPIRRTVTELRAMLVRAPFDIMTIPASDRDTTRRVRQVLAAHPNRSAASVATILSLPPETLRTRLRREGTTLSAIRETWRRDTAIRALARGDRSIEMIAAELGYAEARSFTRAFRAWTGSSPSAFRRRTIG